MCNSSNDNSAIENKSLECKPFEMECNSSETECNSCATENYYNATESHSYVSTQLEVSSDEETLDTHVKNILAIKQIMSRILKGTVSEVKDFSEDEIEMMIEGEPQVGSVPVDPGLSNHPKIKGDNTEDKVPFEGEAKYDVVTHIVVPAKNSRVKILINVEGQNDSNPGYDLVTRGVYYGARRISAQKGVEFTKNYDGIKKVYSIWICFDAEVEERNTITEYHMSRRDIYGTTSDKERYDLISVVFVRIGGKLSEYTEKSLQQFLMYIFTNELTLEQKQQKLEDEYGILMTEQSRREVESMCNYSVGIAKKNLARGMKEGLARGVTEGRNEIVRMVDYLMDQNRYEDLKLATKDESFRQKILDEIAAL